MTPDGPQSDRPRRCCGPECHGLQAPQGDYPCAHRPCRHQDDGRHRRFPAEPGVGASQASCTGLQGACPQGGPGPAPAAPIPASHVEVAYTAPGTCDRRLALIPPGYFPPMPYANPQASRYGLGLILAALQTFRTADDRTFADDLIEHYLNGRSAPMPERRTYGPEGPPEPAGARGAQVPAAKAACDKAGPCPCGGRTPAAILAASDAQGGGVTQGKVCTCRK